MRERSEDLGRIMVYLEDILEQDIFNECRHGYPESFPDIFRGYTIDQQDHILKSYIAWVNLVESKINAVLEIAKGEDYLNGKE